MDVSVTLTKDASQFLESAKYRLAEDETGNNTILSIANQVGSPTSLLRPPYWFAYTEGEAGNCGFAVFAKPDGLVLSEMDAAHCRAVVSNLLKNGVTPERIYAPQEIAVVAADAIARRTGVTFREYKNWRALEVSSPIKTATAPVNGHLRRADNLDVDSIIEIGDLYNEEIPSIVKVSDYFLSRSQAGDLYFWCDGDRDQIRTVIALSGQTDTVVRISAVFTQKEHRGLGYASAAVKQVTNDRLAAGYSTVTLVVDTGEQGATKLYEQLGFSALHDRVEMVAVSQNGRDVVAAAG